MGLIIPQGPNWDFAINNVTGTPPTNMGGTQVIAGANNADGTAVSILSALARDVEYLTIAIGNFAGLAQNGATLLDVLYDPAGGTNWQVLIPSLMAGSQTPSAPFLIPARWYEFPIWVPAGSSIGARARCAHTGTITGRIVINAYGGNGNPASWWAGQRVTNIGINPATSGGTAHTAGNTGAFSSWTNLGSPIVADCGAVQWGIGSENDASATALQYRFEFGVASEIIGTPLIMAMDATVDNSAVWPQGVSYRRLPSGTQLMARGTCSGTAQPIDLAAYFVH